MLLKLLGACCLTFKMVLCKDHDGVSTSYFNRNQSTRLTADTTNIQRCKEKIVEASSKHDFMFSQAAYLEFINLQSEGAISSSSFDSLAIGLTFEFWTLTCAVKKGNCTQNEPVTVYDLLNYQNQDGASSNTLLSEFCARVDEKLIQLISFAPSKEPSERPTHLPSTLPSNLPTKRPTQHPSELPTRYPTQHPTKYPTKLPSDEPTTYPTNHPSTLPTSYPSKSPVISPSLRPSMMPSPAPTVSKTPTFRPSASPTISLRPTDRPTSKEPSNHPSMHPTSTPSGKLV
jgi:hypothetical protein